MLNKRRLDPIERFTSKIDFNSSPFGCWIWQGSFGGQIGKRGYGRFYLNNKNLMAHRFSYEFFNNKIVLHGFVIDHLCHNPNCVNPNHLEMVTGLENTFRSSNQSALNKMKTHCIRGHPLSGNNLWLCKEGTRKYKTCIKLRNQSFRKTGKYTLSNGESENSKRSHVIWKPK